MEEIVMMSAILLATDRVFPPTGHLLTPSTQAAFGKRVHWKMRKLRVDLRKVNAVFQLHFGCEFLFSNKRLSTPR